MARLERRQVIRGLGGVGVVFVGGGIVTAERPEWNEELDSVRSATEEYRGDLAAAKADGWDHGPEFVPRMGHHFIKPANVAVDHGDLALTKPAVLVYDDPEDDQDLLAVEYLIAGNHTEHPPNLFSDETSEDVKTSEEEGWEFIPPEEATGLHAWVWFDNPKGVHHPTNPRAPKKP